MEKLLAFCFLILASTLTTLGNMWFTYGIWPRSWVAFVVFAMLSLTIMSVAQALNKSK